MKKYIVKLDEEEREDAHVGERCEQGVQEQDQVRPGLRPAGERRHHQHRLSLAEALLELQQLTERLRRECPWDREQTARTIVPHTRSEERRCRERV